VAGSTQVQQCTYARAAREAHATCGPHPWGSMQAWAWSDIPFAVVRPPSCVMVVEIVDESSEVTCQLGPEVIHFIKLCRSSVGDGAGLAASVDVDANNDGATDVEVLFNAVADADTPFHRRMNRHDANSVEGDVRRRPGPRSFGQSTAAAPKLPWKPRAGAAERQQPLAKNDPDDGYGAPEAESALRDLSTELLRANGLVNGMVVPVQLPFKVQTGLGTPLSPLPGRTRRRRYNAPTTSLRCVPAGGLHSRPPPLCP